MEIIENQPSTKGPAEWFTGDVWFDVIVPTDGRAQGRCNAVHFTPGARTAWHKARQRPTAARHRRHRTDPGPRRRRRRHPHR
jgi:quercetin dioxygenase-like cupin family protein